MVPIERIKDFIAHDRTEEAISNLKKVFDGKNENIVNELILLQAQYSQFRKEYRLGLKPEPQVLNRIRFALLEYLKQLDSNIQSWMTIEIIEGRDLGAKFWLITPSIFIGRNVEPQNHVLLTDSSVSSLHGTIEYRNNQVLYTHRSLSKEAFITGNDRGIILRMGMDIQCEVFSGDQIRIGNTLLAIEIAHQFKPSQISPTT